MSLATVTLSVSFVHQALGWTLSDLDSGIEVLTCLNRIFKSEEMVRPHIWLACLSAIFTSFAHMTPATRRYRQYEQCNCWWYKTLTSSYFAFYLIFLILIMQLPWRLIKAPHWIICWRGWHVCCSRTIPHHDTKYSEFWWRCAMFRTKVLTCLVQVLVMRGVITRMNAGE